MQVGAKQRLVGVDVADPGDPRLVEQERLQGRAAVGRDLEQPLRRQLAAERLDPEPRSEVGVELVAAEHDRVAEAPRVGEPQLRAVVEDEPSPQVARVGVGLVEAGRAEPIRLHQVDGRVRARPADQQVAGHPQVHDQRRPVVELDDQVLAAAPDRLDPPPGERLLDAVRQLRARPALVEDLGRLDRAAARLGLELAAHGLDLGKLGHTGQSSLLSSADADRRRRPRAPRGNRPRASTTPPARRRACRPSRRPETRASAALSRPALSIDRARARADARLAVGGSSGAEPRERRRCASRSSRRRRQPLRRVSG